MHYLPIWNASVFKWVRMVRESWWQVAPVISVWMCWMGEWQHVVYKYKWILYRTYYTLLHWYLHFSFFNHCTAAVWLSGEHGRRSRARLTCMSMSHPRTLQCVNVTDGCEWVKTLSVVGRLPQNIDLYIYYVNRISKDCFPTNPVFLDGIYSNSYPEIGRNRLVSVLSVGCSANHLNGWPTCSVAVLWIGAGQVFSKSSGCSVKTKQVHQLTRQPHVSLLSWKALCGRPSSRTPSDAVFLSTGRQLGGSSLPCSWWAP